MPPTVGAADEHGEAAVPMIWHQHVDVFVAYDAAEAARGRRRRVAAGGRLVDDSHAPQWWTLADAEGNEVDVATTFGRN